MQTVQQIHNMYVETEEHILLIYETLEKKRFMIYKTTEEENLVKKTLRLKNDIELNWIN